MQRRSLPSAPARALLVLLLALVLSACASGGAEQEVGSPAPPGSAVDLDARIRALEQAVARDEEAIRVLLATPAREGEDPLVDSSSLREISRRLPGLQAELRALRRRRGAQESP